MLLSSAVWTHSTIILLLLRKCCLASLYGAGDQVEQLTGSTFNSTVFDAARNHVLFLEFYNSWCGHCIHFAPVWKALASNTKPWHNFVHVAAIDCNEAANMATCREQEVHGYPTVKFFRPFLTNRSSHGEDCPNLPICPRDEPNLKRSIIEYLERISFPSNIVPISHVPTKSSEISGGKPYVAVFVEDRGGESSIGRNIILSLHDRCKNIDLRRTTVANASEAQELYNVPSIPTMLIIDERGKRQVFTSAYHDDEMTTREFVHTLSEYDDNVGKNYDPASPEIHKKADDFWKSENIEAYKQLMPPDIAEKPSVTPRTTVKVQPVILPSTVDIESSIIYSFQHEIFSHTTFVGRKKQALADYVEALVFYAPIRNTQLLQALENVLAQLRPGKIRSTSNSLRTKLSYKLSVSSQSLMGGFDSAGLVLDSMPMRWHACNSTIPGRRGYPCSLWLLFHTLTLSAYRTQLESRYSPTSDSSQRVYPVTLSNKIVDKNPNAVAYAVNDDGNRGSTGILRVIHNYVEHFFSCNDCKQHFLSTWQHYYDDELEHDAHDASVEAKKHRVDTSRAASDKKAEVSLRDAVIWLFTIHNKVNARLARDATEDPQHPKIKFPSRSMCTACYKSTNSNSAADDSFNYDELLSFLLAY